MTSRAKTMHRIILPSQVKTNSALPQSTVKNAIKVNKNILEETKKFQNVRYEVEPEVSPLVTGSKKDREDNYDDVYKQQNMTIQDIFEGRKAQHRETYLSRNNIGMGVDLAPRVGSIQDTQVGIFDKKFDNELLKRSEMIDEYKRQMDSERPDGSMQTTSPFGSSVG